MTWLFRQIPLPSGIYPGLLGHRFVAVGGGVHLSEIFKVQGQEKQERMKRALSGSRGDGRCRLGLPSPCSGHGVVMY